MRAPSIRRFHLISLSLSALIFGAVMLIDVGGYRKKNLDHRAHRTAISIEQLCIALREYSILNDAFPRIPTSIVTIRMLGTAGVAVDSTLMRIDAKGRIVDGWGNPLNLMSETDKILVWSTGEKVDSLGDEITYNGDRFDGLNNYRRISSEGLYVSFGIAFCVAITSLFIVERHLSGKKEPLKRPWEL